jgi:hypothetical protein
LLHLSLRQGIISLAGVTKAIGLAASARPKRDGADAHETGVAV